MVALDDMYLGDDKPASAIIHTVISLSMLLTIFLLCCNIEANERKFRTSLLPYSSGLLRESIKYEIYFIVRMTQRQTYVRAAIQRRSKQNLSISMD